MFYNRSDGHFGPYLLNLLWPSTCIVPLDISQSYMPAPLLLELILNWYALGHSSDPR